MKHRMFAVALTVSAVSGCGLIGDGDTAPKGRTQSMNMQEAGEQAERILDATFGAVKPRVEVQRGPSSDPICTDFKNDSTGTGQVTRRRYVMTIISDERRGSFLGVVERHWNKNGYEITTVRKHKENPAIFATSPEGFQVVLEFGYRGQASVDVTSPCVTESAVTEPPREPLDPGSPAAKGLPYVRSDFWSAETPAPSPSAS
ncbi:hypothetical protein SSP531S_13570 [Streptomyces spongiicola]|uniref:Uncharacterized protein n=1 Tax=Streptomyces spongiicola TaxID=1690221 RepID=A0A388SV32_9ACTN|nr:hypothetical protein [Streptomyces spongiicola]GBP99953.1 hypothetical protein SSP531S_13570 [Streptomyces spongiicola]